MAERARHEGQLPSAIEIETPVVDLGSLFHGVAVERPSAFSEWQFPAGGAQ
jgi:hypothetical protein